MQTSQSSGTPEHNLNPPKFAKTALEQCCKNANVVMNSIRCGINKFGQYVFFFLTKLFFSLQNGISYTWATTLCATEHFYSSGQADIRSVKQNLEGLFITFCRHSS